MPKRQSAAEQEFQLPDAFPSAQAKVELMASIAGEISKIEDRLQSLRNKHAKAKTILVAPVRMVPRIPAKKTARRP